MKKSLWFLIVVLALALLTACVPMQIEEVEETTIAESAVNDDFISLTIVADNSVYKADEVIECYATLTNMGEEPITVLHSNPLVVFYIEGGDYFSGSYGREDSLNRTTFVPEEELRIEFQKSGGWSADDPNAAFYKTFYEEKELRLPVGQYTLAAHLEYSTDENNMQGTQQMLEVTILITVDD